MSLLDAYAPIVGQEIIDGLRNLGRLLEGTRLLMVNSTRRGGGVAEILERMVPLLNEVGVETSWEIVTGSPRFYQCTKTIHNGLQGDRVDLDEDLIDAYEKAAEKYVARVDTDPYDVVVIHDPQPARLIRRRRDHQKWVWRCHVDAAHPARSVWRFLLPMVRCYDASIFSMSAFAQNVGHPQFIIHPSIDPLSPKNMELTGEEVDAILARLSVPRDLPLLLQVSRFDRFKDPVGVVQAWRRVRENTPCRLVLAGGTADDDPEGEEVLAEVRAATGDDPDAMILVLPADAHRDINALQRAADIVLQKSTKEGFGLTVTEAMLKSRPVIGGAVGGITAQIRQGVNGFLVHSVEGAAHRIRYLLHRREEARRMGEAGRDVAVGAFLLTRHLRDYLLLILALKNGSRRRVEVRLDGDAKIDAG